MTKGPADNDWLTGLRARDERARNEFVERHTALVLALCTRWVGPGEAAEDCARAVFVEALESLQAAGAVPDDVEPARWLCSLTVRLAAGFRLTAPRNVASAASLAS
jgi:DNA-directed RNA polymerase specialized sigma24 family protein